MKQKARFYGVPCFYDDDKKQITADSLFWRICLEIVGRIAQFCSFVYKKITGNDMALRIIIKCD